MLITQELLLWALAGGVLNRFSGWTDYLPGRNIYYAALVVLGLVWYFYGPVIGLLTFVSFLAYRIPGWFKSLDMGTYPGSASVPVDAAIMFARGLFFFPVFAWVAYTQQSAVPLIILAVASAVATASYWIGNHVLVKKMKDPFWFIEFAAGAAFGAAVALVVT